MKFTFWQHRLSKRPRPNYRTMEIIPCAQTSLPPYSQSIYSSFSYPIHNVRISRKKLQDILRGRKHSLNRQSEHHNQTQKWQGCWNYQTRNLKGLCLLCNPEYSLEGLMLKLQHFGHLIRRAHSLEKTLMLEKTEGKRRRGRQKMR